MLVILPSLYGRKIFHLYGTPLSSPCPCSPRFAGRAGETGGGVWSGGEAARPHPIPSLSPPHAAVRRGEGLGVGLFRDGGQG